MKPEELIAEADEALARWEARYTKYALTEEERECWRIGYCYGRGVTAGVKDKLQ